MLGESAEGMAINACDPSRSVSHPDTFAGYKSVKTAGLDIWHADAYQLFLGEQPSSYRATATSVATLLGEYAKREGDVAKAMKEQLYRIVAHSDAFVRGKVSGDYVDLSVDEWFAIIHEKATELFEIANFDAHAMAIERGENVHLQLNRLPQKRQSQEKWVPYLKPSFGKYIKKLLREERFNDIDEQELKVVMMLLHSDYLDFHLQAEDGLDELVGSLTAPPSPRNFANILTKIITNSDVEKNPHAHVEDIVRRSLVTETLEDQEHFVAELATICGGKIKTFLPIRYSSRMPFADEPVKSSVINVVYTPSVETTTATKHTPITFAQMVGDPDFYNCLERRQTRDTITDLHIEAAKELLSHPSIAKASISMIVEFQLFLSHFLQKKKRRACLNKFASPNTAKDLTKRLSKYSKNPKLSYIQTARETFDVSAKADARRKFLQLGLDIDIGSFQRPKTELNLSDNYILRAVRGKSDVELVFQTIIRYCNVFGVTSLGLRRNSIGYTAVKTIGRELRGNKTLLILDLQSNEIGDKGLGQLSKALKTNEGLSYLYLNSNQIGDVGMIKLSEALQNNNTLAWLQLADNNIGDAGAAAIADVIRVNKSLSWLSFSENKIGDEGAVNIGQAIHSNSNSSLMSLNLDDNMIGGKRKQQLRRRVLDDNPNLFLRV